MSFFRMIKMDFKRMFLSGKFYFAIAGAMLVVEHQSGSNAEPVECIGILPGCQQSWCGCIF